MKFSMRTLLFFFAFFSVWLGAIATRSAVALELATLATILTLFLSLPLTFFDPVQRRRSFWAGFCTLGLGCFLTFYVVGDPIEKTNQYITNMVMKVPGIENIPENTTNDVAPVSYVTTAGGTTKMNRTMMPQQTRITIYDSINRAVPFLFLLSFALIGGVIVYFVANNPANGQNNAG